MPRLIGSGREFQRQNRLRCRSYLPSVNAVMPDLILPAPLWRRLAAAVYDGLLLIALWMVTLLLICLPLNSLLGLPPGNAVNRALLLTVALGFLVWFWTRGGQTLGMRAWRLQVRRGGGALLRMPVAVVRAMAALIYWGLVLTPAAASMIHRAPSLESLLPHVQTASIGAGLAVLLSLVAARLDARRRLPQDWMTGSEVVLLPLNPFPAAPKAKKAGGRKAKASGSGPQ